MVWDDGKGLVGGFSSVDTRKAAPPSACERFVVQEGSTCSWTSKQTAETREAAQACTK